MLATPAPDLALLGTHISAPACGHGPRITHHASSIKHQASRFTLAYAQVYQHAAEPWPGFETSCAAPISTGSTDALCAWASLPGNAQPLAQGFGNGAEGSLYLIWLM